MPKFDYWEDDFDGRPPHGEGYHDGPHGNPYDYPHDHHHPHPPYDGRRHQPVDVGKVDTTKMHDRYDMHVPFHMPPWGFKFPKLEKAFVPGSTPQEQVAYLLNRVDTMIDYFNHYDDKVWGAYNAVVHSALGNEAYYREITREEGYLADGSTPYTVIHIPYLDRAERPIYLELGLAFNNTTNNGVKENVFEASQNRVADKLIPAFNIADGWEGKAMLKGAPIQSVYTEGKFTLAVTDNGFLKIYPNTVAYEQLNRDRIRNAMGVQGVLINNGAKTPEQYASNGGELLARVGIGMNYETKERIIVIVNGNPTPPIDRSATGATADMFADIFARYGCTVAVETANNGSAVAMDKGQIIYMPDTALTGTIPTVPSLNCYWYITKRRHYHNQYVKDVADLIQKVGQNKWRCEIALQSCDFLKGRVNELQRDLDAEVQNRIDADNQLQANIDAEEQARIDADERLQDNIDAEAEARRQADAQLQDNIDAEATAREQGDNALDTRITNEVATLNERITQVVTELNNAIDTERQARIDGDNALSTRITNEVATLNALIDAEEQARIAGDTALQNSLAQLRADYTAFLTTYANDLAETRRLLTALRSDISTIQGQIADLQSNLSAVNTSITAILATINTIEESFENIKTAFTTLQSDWHDYKDDVDAEILQLQQEWATYKTTIMSDVETLVREIIAEEGGITPEIMALIQNAQWKTETSNQLFSETATTSQTGTYSTATLTYSEPLTADTLKVIYNGVEYVCPRHEIAEGVYAYGGVDDYNEFVFTEVPFVIGSQVDSEEHAINTLITESPQSAPVVVSVESVEYTDKFIEAVKSISNGCDCVLDEQIDYYIDPNEGSDNNDGLTSLTPFKTIAHFNDIAKRLTNNGVYNLYLMGGSYTEPLALHGIGATVNIFLNNESTELSAEFGDFVIDKCKNITILPTSTMRAQTTPLLRVEQSKSLVIYGNSTGGIMILDSYVRIGDLISINASDILIVDSKVYLDKFTCDTLPYDCNIESSQLFVDEFIDNVSSTTGAKFNFNLSVFSDLFAPQNFAGVATINKDDSCRYITES